MFGDVFVFFYSLILRKLYKYRCGLYENKINMGFRHNTDGKTK